MRTCSKEDPPPLPPALPECSIAQEAAPAPPGRASLRRTAGSLLDTDALKLADDPAGRVSIRRGTGSLLTTDGLLDDPAGRASIRRGAGSLLMMDAGALVGDPASGGPSVPRPISPWVCERTEVRRRGGGGGVLGGPSFGHSGAFRIRASLYHPPAEVRTGEGGGGGGLARVPLHFFSGPSWRARWRSILISLGRRTAARSWMRRPEGGNLFDHDPDQKSDSPPLSIQIPQSFKIPGGRNPLLQNPRSGQLGDRSPLRAFARGLAPSSGGTSPYASIVAGSFFPSRAKRSACDLGLNGKYRMDIYSFLMAPASIERGLRGAAGAAGGASARAEFSPTQKPPVYRLSIVARPARRRDRVYPPYYVSRILPAADIPISARPCCTV